MQKLTLFEGYKKSSSRYSTKKLAEVIQRDENAETLFLKLEDLLARPELLSPLELDIYEKRYKSLKQLFKKEKTADLQQLFVPFFIDIKTVVFVREKNCFKSKWVARFGRKRIEDTIKKIKLLEQYRPKNTIFWNPF